MSLPRFYCEHLPHSGCIELCEHESRHAVTILRLKADEPVIAFDGIGGEARCLVTKVGKRSVELTIVERTDTCRELAQPLAMFVSLPKGDRQKSLVDAMVQLGVQALTPLVTQRSVVQPSAATLDKLRRSVIESSKQCGRNCLMKIHEPIELPKLAELGASPHLKAFAHPYGSARTMRDLARDAESFERGELIIGPEGGLTESEAESLRQHQWLQIQLGPRILRVEMAATLLAAWWQTK